jgi:hypothetical protein
MLLVEKFQDFLHRSGHTRESFARLMGVQPSLLSRLIPKDGIPPVREPRLSTLIKLAKASNGAIGFEDFSRAGAFLGDDQRGRRCPRRGQPTVAPELMSEQES